MKKTKKIQPKIIPILQASLNTISENHAVAFPYTIILFIQILVLEILYFFPQWPLNIFFRPIISKLWSENFMHYPFNLTLLPKFITFASIPIFILLSSFLICMAISAIVSINNNEKPKPGNIFKTLLPYYVHIVTAASIMFLTNKLLIHGLDLIHARAMIIRSTTGPFFWLKTTIIYGAPYFSLLLNIIGTALFVYVLPLIVIEKRNVFVAIIENFKLFFSAPVKTFIIVFLPTVLYTLILLSKNNVPLEGQIPEMRVVYLVVSSTLIVFINAIVYTSITTFYLIRKGQ